MKKNSYLPPFQSSHQIGAMHRGNTQMPCQYSMQTRNLHMHNSIEGRHCNDGTTEFDDNHGFIHAPFSSHYKASVFSNPNATSKCDINSTKNQLSSSSNHNRNERIIKTYTTQRYSRPSTFASPRSKGDRVITFKALLETLDRIANSSSNSMHIYDDDNSTTLHNEKKQLDELIENISIALREKTQHNVSLRLYLNYIIGLK
jgi:hypothetical protein